MYVCMQVPVYMYIYEFIVCLCGYDFIGVCRFICEHVWRLEAETGCFPQLLLYFILRQDLSLNLQLISSARLMARKQ